MDICVVYVIVRNVVTFTNEAMCRVTGFEKILVCQRFRRGSFFGKAKIVEIRASQSLRLALFLIHIVLSGLNSFSIYDINRKRIFGFTAALSVLRIDRF